MKKVRALALLVTGSIGAGKVLRVFPGTAKGEAAADKFCETLPGEWTIHYLHADEVVSGLESYDLRVVNKS